ncbi:acyloxyacyl hydrolase, partial [Aeromonas caviae]
KLEEDGGDQITESLVSSIQLHRFGQQRPFNQNWLLGYQYEHMSNGHMYEHNPSLDSHTLHIDYRF